MDLPVPAGDVAAAWAGAMTAVCQNSGAGEGDGSYRRVRVEEEFNARATDD